MRDRGFILLLAQRKRSGFVGWLLVLLCLVMSSSLSAATVTWTGLGTTNNWNDAANWDTNPTLPTTGDALVFAGIVKVDPNVNNLAADTSFASITFSSGAGAFVITGNRIILTGNIVNNDDSVQTINLDIAPAAWTPASLATAAWFDASDASTITQSGGVVSQWNDKSTNGRNATQGTGANQPTYAAASLNGLATLDFDGTNDEFAVGGSAFTLRNLFAVFNAEEGASFGNWR